MRKIFAVAVLAALSLGACARNGNNGITGKLIQVPEDFPTITMALRNANDGDVVEITRSGTYNEASGEQFPLLVRDGVTLRKGWTRSVTIDMDSPNQVPTLEVGSNVTIIGIYFTCTSAMAVAQKQGGTDVAFLHCGFWVKQVALLFNGFTRLRLEGNAFYCLASSGLRRALTLWGVLDANIENNTFSGFDKNVLVEASTNVNFERNLVVNATGAGLEVDDASLPTMTFSENCFWGNKEGMWNKSVMVPFFPATGGNISADPLFIDRENPAEIHEGSRCILSNGGVIGAYGAVKLGAKPQVRKLPNSPNALIPGASIPVMYAALSNTGT
ncbi:MAG: right-handed parallel beta-helix repeat-containing protein, partial [bacterium]|nr:right-handed parallel beta-helix repeat-containing protein [bacterium]